MMDVYVPVGEFNAALWKRFQEGKIRNVYPLSKYNDIVKKIKTMEENPPCNMPGEYYLLRKFIVVNIAGKERLSCKPENGSTTEKIRDICVSKTKFYVALEEIYKYIDEAHKTTKHGGRDRIVRVLHNQGVVNVTRDTVELFLSFCKVCRPRRKDLNRRCSTRNVISPSLQNDSCDSPVSLNNENESADRLPVMRNIVVADTIKIELDGNSGCSTVCSFTRGYMDLLDFSSTPDGDYRFVFLYLDLQTCFSILYPVRCKCTHELVSHLLSIFTLIGPPQVLHSNFDEQFFSSIIQELKLVWPESIIVSGSSSYVELQDVAQKCISELYEMLRLWMSENNSGHWSFGIKFTQLRKNTKLVGNNAKSPYECFFGRSPNMANLPPSLDISLLTQALKEDELLNLINQHKGSEPEHCESLQVSVDPNICSLVQNNGQQNVQISQPTDSEQIIQSSVIKIEPVSDEDETEENGIEISDSSCDVSNSPKVPSDEIQIKQEPGDS